MHKDTVGYIAAVESTRANIRLQALVLAGGMLLMAIKFAAWWLTHSNTILSDALESIVNVTAGSFALYSLWLAAKPRDREHPYGHGKVEFISAGIEGGLVVLAGLLWFLFGVDQEQVTADLLDEAIKARVQAFGRSAEEERYRALLDRLPLEDVRGFRDEWRSIASGRLPVGRRSEDGGDPLPTPADQDGAIARLARVRLAVIDRRPFSEYGHGAFGTTFDQRIAAWLRRDFVRVDVLRGAGPESRTIDVWTRRTP